MSPRALFSRSMLLAVVLAGAALGWWLFGVRLDPAAIEATISELGWLG